MESNDKENGRYTFMGVDPQEIIQSDRDHWIRLTGTFVVATSLIC